MRTAARALIIHEDQLLLMHRHKFGHEYYTLIGGAIAPHETPDQAVLREIKEETGVQVTDLQPVFVEEAGDPYGTQYIFVCKYVGGTPALAPDSEEAQIHQLGQNLYTPLWVPVPELQALPFRSERLKQALIDGLQHGWPAQPQVLNP